MRITDFASSNTYIFLPTNKNPKVAITVDNPSIANNAFNLYNPFSQKAKVLKKISHFSFVSFNGFSKLLWRSKKKEKSAFVSYLEELLSKSLVISIYFATANDKVVLQLQTPDAKIVGYLKYPVSTLGLKHIQNEKKAIEILSKKDIFPKYILYDEFNRQPFILLRALNGRIGLVERSDINKLLLRFKRESFYLLGHHPRIIELKKNVMELGLSDYLFKIEVICQNSNIQYALVYEHGDFTPWNIINVQGTYIPFDFEHFVEDGLEYFDLIKYYYQIGKLLNQLDAPALITFISEQIEVKEITALLQLFVIKEMVRNKKENEPYGFEANMLEMLNK